MGKKEFEEFLKETKEKKESAIDWTKQRDEWLKCVKKLYDQINEWLSEYIKKNKITINYRSMQITEDFIGTYDAAIMEILIGKTTISLTPIGTIMVATKGRVDMMGPSDTIRFVLADKDSSEIKVTSTIVVNPKESKKVKEKPKTIDDKINWVWKIVTNNQNIKLVDLDMDNFFDALMRVK